MKIKSAGRKKRIKERNKRHAGLFVLRSAVGKWSVESQAEDDSTAAGPQAQYMALSQDPSMHPSVQF